MNRTITIVYFVCLITVIQPKLYGQNWTDISPHFDYPDSLRYNYNGFFINEDEGWFQKDFPGALWHTNDGGITWEKQIDSSDNWFRDIQFINEFHGWITGYRYIRPGYEYFILITKDGGKNWEKYLTQSLSCISFSDSLNGFAGRSSIYSTTDGGITWYPQKVDSGVIFGIRDIYFCDRNNGWAVGSNGYPTYIELGIVLNTTNGGKYWNVNRNIPTGIGGIICKSVYFTDSLHGCIVGTDAGYSTGVIAATNDCGLNWEIDIRPPWGKIDSPSHCLNDVVFIDDSIGWIVGDYGYILNTTDRGETWTRIESSTTSDLNNIFFFNNGEVGYILGDNSTLLKYDKTVGITDQSQPVVSSFKLFQNYPNPFNPTTTINYSIPNVETRQAPSLLVQLTVYDLLGREVATLVNKEQSPGKYSVNFDGSNLTTGVYIYRITAGDFVQSYKMLLLR